MEEREFVRRAVEAGGRAAVVGGWVRDRIRGTEPKDKDYVIAGLAAERFSALFPEAICVGKSFPVFLLSIDGVKCEVALARKERKQGTGYRGFSVCADGTVSLEDDLSRRDTTMNAMAYELLPGREPRLIDLFGGAADIRARRIRAVSERFLEDPVRALRAARQAAAFGYDVEEGTLRLMGACRDELTKEPVERVFHEMEQALASPRPSVFFRTLLAANLLDDVFPELFSLIGKTQPVDFHPEGDAFEHTMQVTDEVARGTENVVVRFAGLAHDLGKGTTPADMLPHHYGHEARGLDVLAAWDARMTLPKVWKRVAAFVIAEHMRAPRLKKPGKIVDLLFALDGLPVPAEEVLLIFRADKAELPPYLLRGRELLDRLAAVTGRDAPKELRGEAVGAWLRAARTRLCGKLLGEWKQ